MRLYKYLVLIFLSSCAASPWVKYPMKVKPDRSCYTGSEAGSVAYTWECYEGERVVIYQNQSGFYTWPAQKETVACGSLTEIEKVKKFFPSPDGACWKLALPYRSEDRFISNNVELKTENEIKGCERLGQYKGHADNFEKAQKNLIEQMRFSYANAYVNLKNTIDERWYEIVYLAEADAYFCSNVR